MEIISILAIVDSKSIYLVRRLTHKSIQPVDILLALFDNIHSINELLCSWIVSNPMPVNRCKLLMNSSTYHSTGWIRRSSAFFGNRCFRYLFGLSAIFF